MKSNDNWCLSVFSSMCKESELRHFQQSSHWGKCVATCMDQRLSIKTGSFDFFKPLQKEKCAFHMKTYLSFEKLRVFSMAFHHLKVFLHVRIPTKTCRILGFSIHELIPSRLQEINWMLSILPVLRGSKLGLVMT